MHIYIGSDHGGFSQKEAIRSWLESHGYTVTDCGTYSAESTDYPDFALAVGLAVSQRLETRGILLCRSGEGMEIAVNKVPKIRGSLVWNPVIAAETRHDNDANVLVLPSDFITEQDALKIVEVFLTTEFSGEERHIRRLEKLHNIEHVSFQA